MRVLIAEDEASVRATFSHIASERGHAVMAVDVRGGSHAFSAAAAQLIITDWDAAAFADLSRAIRAGPREERPYIIVVTDRDQLSDVDVALAAGADDFVVKPVTPQLLQMRLAIAERAFVERSEMRRAERALLDSERRLTAVFKRSPSAICLLDCADNRFLDANDAFCKLVARARVELVGRSAASLDLHFEPELITTLRAMPDTGGATMATLDRGGESTVQLILAAEMVELTGRRCWLATMTDVTERERLRSQLLLADRMASLGTLAAGVAHEINNPLAYVLANVDFVVEQLRRTPKQDALIEALDEAHEGCERMQGIVRDLKIFSRADDSKIGSVDLHAVLDSAISLVQNEIRHRARLERDYHAIPSVRGEAGRLGQVFVNLLANAAQAIPEGDAAKNLISVRTGVDHEGMVFVTIADTGCGIPPQNVSRVFDPFFTTKPVGEGSGLGLSICQALITGSGGQIIVDSEVDLGSIFVVSLQASGEILTRPKQPLTERREGSRRGRILVIDDEVMITRSLLRVLHHDHDVDAVQSAREGLERLQAGQSYDVILCDLMMPDMTGMDLHAELSANHKDLLDRIVFLTGGAFTTRARQFLENAHTQWIEKPVNMQALREMIQARLVPHS